LIFFSIHKPEWFEGRGTPHPALFCALLTEGGCTMSTLRALFVVLLTLSLAACAHYYKVTDPATGKAYYTKDIDHKGSAVEFKNAQTGSSMTLQNSEVAKIDKQAYEAGVGTVTK